MKWYTKLLIFLGIGTLVFVIVGMGYVIKAKYQMNEYTLQLGAAFNAATMVNATETFTDPDRAVIINYNGQETILVPENYKALLSYLRRDHAMPFLSYLDKETALHISVCNKSHLFIQGDRDGQGALIHFETAGKAYRMHVSGGDLWEKIVTICTKGRNNYPNLQP